MNHLMTEDELDRMIARTLAARHAEILAGASPARVVVGLVGADRAPRSSGPPATRLALLVAALLLLLLGVVAGGWLAAGHRVTTPMPLAIAASPAPSPASRSTLSHSPAPATVDGWTRYHSDRFGYSVGMPGAWVARAADPASTDTDFYLKGYGRAGAGADWLAPRGGIAGVQYKGVLISAHTSPRTEAHVDDILGQPCPDEVRQCTERIIIDGETGRISWAVNQGLARATVPHGKVVFSIVSALGDDHDARTLFRAVLGSIVFTAIAPPNPADSASPADASGTR